MSERGETQASKGRAILDNVKRIRQPVTWAVLAIICASQILGVVRLVLLLVREQTPVFEAFQEIVAGYDPAGAPHQMFQQHELGPR